jgi:hypothetical protein
MEQAADSPEPNKGGRPAFVATDQQREMVMTLAGMLCPHDQIARFLSIGHSTLKRHFRNELTNGREQLLVRLKQVIARQAMAGSIRAATWLVEGLDNQFVLRRDVDEAGGATKYIIVRNGLPDLPGPENNYGEDLPGPHNDWGNGPKPNGNDEPTDADAP